MTPLFPEFNRIVMEMAPPYDLTEDGESCDTLEKITEYYGNSGRLLIWSGNSLKTIFGESSVNHAFRAWHDLAHITGQYAFDRVGERQAMEYQQTQVKALYGSELANEACLILQCEVMGQIEYVETYGNFPEDQRAFTINYMKGLDYDK